MQDPTRAEIKIKLDEAYDMLMLSPEHFMSIYNITILGGRFPEVPEDQFYIQGQTLKYALSMSESDDITDPKIIMAPFDGEWNKRVYSQTFSPYVVLMNKEDDVAFDERHLNNLPYVHLLANSATKFMVTAQLSGCTLCSWQKDDGSLLVAHIQPSGKQKDKADEDVKGKGKEKETDSDTDTKKESTGYRLQSLLMKKGGFVGHPESIGQLTCYGPKEYSPQIRNKANVIGWNEGEGNWHLIAQLINPRTPKVIDTYPINIQEAFLNSKKEQEKHPYPGPNFRKFPEY